jgi:hypothetical protein
MTITHHYDNKIKPTPCVCEIFGKTKRKELDQHLKKEDNGENSVHVVQNILQNWSVL